MDCLAFLFLGERNQILMADEYRKGWALRYLREAKAELIAAQKMPYMAPSLILEAVRKAQVAIYYSLGDPAFVEAIVHQTLGRKKAVDDPVLRCLVEIERMVQRVVRSPHSDHGQAIEETNGLIRIASDIVELLTGETA
ncbi:MAG: hypothetical protein JSV85_01665 [Candidatus Bathyarchaeota archaeon]|nr:MAG: hypothetical protein JSV85_01665 [Candidatus Bathyarchaeota archaeon]